MPDDKAGVLFKHILRYVNDLNPTTDDLLIDIAFEPIKQQLKRDLLHWESVKEKRSEAGKASANKRQQVSTSVKSVKQNVTESTVIENVNVNVNDNDIINEDKTINNVFTFDEFWEQYPTKESKKVSKERFDKLSNSEKELIKQTLPAFINYKRFPEYNHPNPATYLKQKRWEDEIPIASIKKVTQVQQSLIKLET